MTKRRKPRWKRARAYLARALEDTDYADIVAMGGKK